MEEICTVERIAEDDYGCEELPEGEKVKVLVILKHGDGTEEAVRAGDEDLYRKNIREGSRVVVRDHVLYPAPSQNV